MKIRLMNLPQLPLFQPFSVRMLCVVLFFNAVFISSKTSFYNTDSVIFISEGSYLFEQSEIEIYIKSHCSEPPHAWEKQEYKLKSKTLCKQSLSSARKNTQDKIGPLCFRLPKSSHFIVNAENLLSAALLGTSSPLKKYYKITDPIFRTFLRTPVSKQKLHGMKKESINLLKIIVSHFSRPPPVI